MSISTILRRLTVKFMTENGCFPGSLETIPAAPFTSTGRANSTSREKVRGLKPETADRGETGQRYVPYRMYRSKA